MFVLEPGDGDGFDVCVLSAAARSMQSARMQLSIHNVLRGANTVSWENSCVDLCQKIAKKNHNFAKQHFFI